MRLFSIAIAVLLLIAATPTVSQYNPYAGKDKIKCYQSEDIKLNKFFKHWSKAAPQVECDGKNEYCYQKLEKGDKLKLGCIDKNKCRSMLFSMDERCTDVRNELMCCCSADLCIAHDIVETVKTKTDQYRYQCYQAETKLDTFLTDKGSVKTCKAEYDEICYQKLGKDDKVTLKCMKVDQCKKTDDCVEEDGALKCCCSTDRCFAPKIAATVYECYQGELKLAKFLADKKGSVTTCPAKRGQVCYQTLEGDKVKLGCGKEKDCKEAHGENMIECQRDTNGKIKCCCNTDKCVGLMIDPSATTISPHQEDEEEEDDDDDHYHKKKASSLSTISPLVVLLLATVALFALLTDRRRVFASA